MTERVGRVSRFAQTSQQANFQRRFFRPSDNHFQEPLHFSTLRKIAHLDPVRLNLDPIVRETLGVRFLVNPVDGRN